MQDVIDALRDRQKASAGQAPPVLEERRAAFVPVDRPHPVPAPCGQHVVNGGGEGMLGGRAIFRKFYRCIHSYCIHTISNAR